MLRVSSNAMPAGKPGQCDKLHHFGAPRPPVSAQRPSATPGDARRQFWFCDTRLALAFGRFRCSKVCSNALLHRCLLVAPGDRIWTQNGDRREGKL